MPSRRPAEGGVHRSLGRADFRNVYRGGRRYATPVATVHILPATRRGFRVAVPVGKRIGSAVIRNRVRRRLREAYLRVQKELRPGGDIVIVARSAAETAPFESLVVELRKAFQDAGITGQ